MSLAKRNMRCKAGCTVLKYRDVPIYKDVRIYRDVLKYTVSCLTGDGSKFCWVLKASKS